jgi:hypothetical protein
METFEDRYLDILQNIESALIRPYLEDEEMTDFETLNAVNALIRSYTAEMRRRSQPDLKLNPLEQKSYGLARSMCELRLGRTELERDGEPIELEMRTVTVSEMVDCLKRIRRSVQIWQKEGGRRGYYEFISGFMP